MSEEKTNSMSDWLKSLDDSVKKMLDIGHYKSEMQPLQVCFTKEDIEKCHKKCPEQMKKVKGKWYLNGVEVVTPGKFKRASKVKAKGRKGK